MNNYARLYEIWPDLEPALKPRSLPRTMSNRIGGLPNSTVKAIPALTACLKKLPRIPELSASRLFNRLLRDIEKAVYFRIRIIVIKLDQPITIPRHETFSPRGSIGGFYDFNSVQAIGFNSFGELTGPVTNFFSIPYPHRVELDFDESFILLRSQHLLKLPSGDAQPTITDLSLIHETYQKAQQLIDRYTDRNAGPFGDNDIVYRGAGKILIEPIKVDALSVLNAPLEKERNAILDWELVDTYKSLTDSQDGLRKRLDSEAPNFTNQSGKAEIVFGSAMGSYVAPPNLQPPNIIIASKTYDAMKRRYLAQARSEKT